LARRNPQTLGKRQREQAKREKRERKQQKKAAAAAARSEQQLIVIETYPTREEAEVVQGLLATAGIEAAIKADDAGGAFPFVLSGGAQVLVDESDATAASELLAAGTDAS
jgi:putative signal transducing protein